MLLSLAVGAILAIGKYSAASRDQAVTNRFQAVEADAAKIHDYAVAVERLQGSIHVLEERQSSHSASMTDLRSSIAAITEKLNEVLERLPRRRIK
jgi:chromosome segregation ATPase